MNIKIRLALVALLAWLITPMAATAAETPALSPNFAVADRYFATYLTGDIAALSPWMDQRIHFHDSASDFQGKEETLKGLIDVFKSVRMGAFAEAHRQRDGERCTYQGTLRFQMDGAAFGAPGNWYDFDVPFSVILQMNGDKVIEHQDLVDGPALNSQFLSQYHALKQAPD